MAGSLDSSTHLSTRKKTDDEGKQKNHWKRNGCSQAPSAPWWACHRPTPQLISILIHFPLLASIVSIGLFGFIGLDSIASSFGPLQTLTSFAAKP